MLNEMERIVKLQDKLMTNFQSCEWYKTKINFFLAKTLNSQTINVGA